MHKQNQSCTESQRNHNGITFGHIRSRHSSIPALKETDLIGNLAKEPRGAVLTVNVFGLVRDPSLNMLDSDKCVLMKDATPENIFTFIDNLN